MNTQDIKEIEEELSRFKKVLDKAYKRSIENKGWEHEGRRIGIGDFQRTRESGALKRASLDLKRVLTDKLSR